MGYEMNNGDEAGEGCSTRVPRASLLPLISYGSCDFKSFIIHRDLKYS